MRKKIIILLVISSILLIACQKEKAVVSGDQRKTSTSESSVDNNLRPDDLSDYEVVRVHGSRILFDNLSDLEGASELIIIGQVQDTQQQLDYEYSSEYGKDILMDATSYSKVKVLKVLSGDIDTDEVVVKHECGVLEEEKQLVTFSEMTPLEKGDVWIFFLYEEFLEEDAEDVDEDFLQNTYWCTGDYTGRYPMPDESLLEEIDVTIISEEVKSLNYGVWEESNAQHDLYMEILEKYDLTL